MKYLGVMQALKLTFWLWKWDQGINVESAIVPFGSAILLNPHRFDTAGGDCKNSVPEKIIIFTSNFAASWNETKEKYWYLHEWKVQGWVKHFLSTQQLHSDFPFLMPCIFFSFIFYFCQNNAQNEKWPPPPLFFFKCQKWDRLTWLSLLSPSPPPHPFPFLPQEILAKIDTIFHMWSKW